MIWQLDRMSVDGHHWKKLIVVGSPLHVRQGNAVLEHAFVASTRNLCMLRSKLRCDVLWRCCKPFILSSPSCFSKGLKNRKSVFPKAVWAIVSISLLASGDAAGFILDFLAVTKLKVCVEPSCPRRSLQASL